MSPQTGLDPLRELLHNMTARYIRVVPAGLQIDGLQHPRRTIDARILGHGGARTLYHARQPVCRSLDGVRPLKDAEKTCLDCHDRNHCTPQVRVDLFYDGLPFRLLLAFTSGKNFLLYASSHTRSAGVSGIHSRIHVIDRGSWGEVTFEEINST